MQKILRILSRVGQNAGATVDEPYSGHLCAHIKLARSAGTFWLQHLGGHKFCQKPSPVESAGAVAVGNISAEACTATSSLEFRFSLLAEAGSTSDSTDAGIEFEELTGMPMSIAAGTLASPGAVGSVSARSVHWHKSSGDTSLKQLV